MRTLGPVAVIVLALLCAVFDALTPAPAEPGD